MKLKKYALFAEIISAIAIVASLVFVGMGIRQSADETALNTSAIQAQTVQFIQSELREVFDFPENYLTTIEKDQSQYTTTDHIIRRGYFSRIMRIYENQWYQNAQGFLDDELFKAYQQHIRITLNDAYNIELWEIRKNLEFFHPGFVEYVELMLQENPAFSESVINVQ